eukprot:scaffold21019_cov104-Skeletonema_dohrnii-CCMP3373.AAC.3
MDVRTTSSREEYALGVVHMSNVGRNDAQIKFIRGERALGMGHPKEEGACVINGAQAHNSEWCMCKCN